MIKILKRILLGIIVIALLLGGTIFYCFRIEPYRIQVNDYTLTTYRENTTQYKIVQFSDTHIKSDFTYQNLVNIVDKINAQHPDIVIFTGDLYDNYATYNDDDNIIDVLQQIEAKYAKLAIWGNHDYGGGAVRAYPSIMEQSGFTLLENENQYVDIKNGKSILFTGLDDALFGNPYIPESTDTSVYSVLLLHEPDAIDDYLTYDYPLALSGHSHGGQVRLPFVDMITTSLAEKYTGGMYSLSSDNEQQLYVNTGIGTTHISARFGVVPEITVFNLHV